MKAHIEDLKKIPRIDRNTHYDILPYEKAVWISTNDYIIAKKAVGLFDEPFNESYDTGDRLLEIAWRVPIIERKKLAKIGLNGNALGRKKQLKETAKIMQE